MKRTTLSKRKSSNKTLRGGANCGVYVQDKLTAINKARGYLNEFYQLWLPTDAYNEKGENLHYCGEFVSSYIQEALHFLNAAEDEYQENCGLKGGARGYSETEVAVEEARKKNRAEASARAAKILEGRKMRFRKLLKTLTKLLEDARNVLNKSIDKDNECYKKCKLNNAVKSVVAAIKKIDDTIYLLVSSVCNE